MSTPASHLNPPQTKKNQGVGGRLLQTYGTDLTVESQSLDPIYGREKELEELTRSLLKFTKNNVILVDDPGVGKTAVVEVLAQQIVSGAAPAALSDCHIIAIDSSTFLSGTEYRGTLKNRLSGLIDEIKNSEAPIILFVDEIHILVGAGKVEGSNIDVANILKPALARGEFRCIGATTFEEYALVQQDMAFARRFDVVKSR